MTSRDRKGSRPHGPDRKGPAGDDPERGSIRAAARKFGISRETLASAIRKGEIPVYVLPGQVRWRRVRFADVETWIGGGRVVSSTDAGRFARGLLDRQSSVRRPQEERETKQ